MFGNQGNKSNKPLAKISKITENIYLGNQQDSQNSSLLKDKNITHIVMCCETLNAHFPQEINYKHLKISTRYWNCDISEYFEETIEFMKQGTCMVHCREGKHRSPCFVLAYLIKEKNMSYKEASSLVSSKRPIVSPPKEFIEILKNYETKIRSNQIPINQDEFPPLQ